MRTRRAAETAHGGRKRRLARDRAQRRGRLSLLNKRRRACLGVECQIVGDAVAYRNRLLK